MPGSQKAPPPRSTTSGPARPRDHLPLQRPEGGLAVLGEDGRDRLAGAPLDLGVGVDDPAAEQAASSRATVDLPEPIIPASARRSQRIRAA